MTRRKQKQKPDIIIVGAGLAGLMAAWRVLAINTQVNILIVEASDSIAGDHTWSFNLSDIRPDMQEWIKPFIAYQWPEYDVLFPRHKRTVQIPYCTGNSKSLRACVQPYVDQGRLDIQLNTVIETLSSTTVKYPNGTIQTASFVCDARGFEPNPNVVLGYQKFVGHTIKTLRPHGVKRPVIMDATVEQIGGYRFVYCLPFSDTELLVEDTYYTDGPELDADCVKARIENYMSEELAIKNYSVIRKEKGILPITLAVEKDHGERVDVELKGPVLLGMRGGYYHAVTGYSTLEAVKSAEVISDMIQKNTPDYGAAVLNEMTYHKRDHYHEERFLRLLSRMLFRAADPQKRYRVLERFYRLPDDLIARFYRNHLTKKDKLRILVGKPPVPVIKALASFSEHKFIEREKSL